MGLTIKQLFKDHGEFYCYWLFPPISIALFKHCRCYRRQLESYQSTILIRVFFTFFPPDIIKGSVTLHYQASERTVKAA